MKWMFHTEDHELMAWWPPVKSETALMKLVRAAIEPDMTTWEAYPAVFKLESCKYLFL
jgi:hypothetical protein